MQPNIIIRHRKERLAKCSLRGLEEREDLLFFRYPDRMPEAAQLDGCILLALDAPVLTPADTQPLLLIDGTWRHAAKMHEQVTRMPVTFIPRSLPADLRTAYPRKQTECPDPDRGLASVEALFAAYALTGRDTTGLLDGYLWTEQFISMNKQVLEK